MTDKSKQVAERIIAHYGSNHQAIKCIEELSELQQAICKHINQPSEKTHDHLTEELADTMVMFYQLIRVFDINEDRLETIMDYKLERTLKLMKKESK